MAISTLRDDILKYEKENGKPYKCKIMQIRCHRCPVSAVGCPTSRKWLNDLIKKQ